MSLPISLYLNFKVVTKQWSVPPIVLDTDAVFWP